MTHCRLVVLLMFGWLFQTPSEAQTVEELDRLWRQTFDAVRAGPGDDARQAFGRFNEELRRYWSTPDRWDWKSRYLAGSLYCQFSGSQSTGLAILKTLVQDGRDLSDAAKAEVVRIVQACSSTGGSFGGDTPHNLPADMIDASAHFQSPGVHSATKGGYIATGEELSGVAVSPIPAAELLARRVLRSDTKKALAAAQSRIPGKTSGSVVDGFAVTTTGTDPAPSLGIGNCLASYARPLRDQFGMEPSQYMVTVYTATWEEQVYDDARRLHGLVLPLGVVAYSVAEDLSIVGMASPAACGSLAHELVHLLIRPSFPLSPAWLEEGLASEVAVALPQGSQFQFAASWRDRTLKDNWSLRPSVGTLLDLSWSDFRAASVQDLRRAAAVQAMAAVFIRYLDAKGKLVGVYTEVRDHLFTADRSAIRTSQQIVQQALGARDVDAIDTDFDHWFNSPHAAPQSR